MNPFLLLVRRDLALGLSRGGATLPVAFFLLVATLFPFAIGPDAGLIQAVGGGALWIAALLAALLPIDRLTAPDRDAGVTDQLTARGISEERIACAKIIAHWIGFGPPLMVAAVVAAALLRLDGIALGQVEAGLLIGTPALAALAVATSALTLGLRGAGALAGLVMLPLAVPVLIFGAGALGEHAAGALKLLGAVSLVLVVGAPFAAAAALRADRS